MTDAERYAADAAECEEQAKRSFVPDHQREWRRLARSYRLLAEQAALGGSWPSRVDRGQRRFTQSLGAGNAASI
jgi:hypothetical protein